MDDDLTRLEQMMNAADKRAEEAREFLTKFLDFIVVITNDEIHSSLAEALAQKIQELEKDALEMATALTMFYNSYKWNKFEPFYDSEAWERWGPRAAKEQDESA